MKLSTLSTLRKLVGAVVVIYTAVIAAILYVNVSFFNESVLDLALGTAEANFRKDMEYRRWLIDVGGVYVAVSDRVRPNPYMNFPEREVNTRSGRTLTLFNPMYMIEQVFSASHDSTGHTAHMVSLDPVRNVQRPDEWEREALESFERGAERRYELRTVGGQEVLRFIKPVFGLPFLPGADTARRVPMYRGGLSYTIPLAGIAQHHQDDFLFDTGILGVIWLLGLAGIYVFARLLRREVYRRIQDQDRFQQVTEQSIDIIYIVDRNGNVTRANAAFYRHLGRERQDQAPLRLTDFIAHLSEEELLTRVEPLFREPSTFESQHITADGSSIPVEVTVIPVTIDDRQYLYCTGRDISERKVREEKVKRSEQLFRQIWEQTGEGLRLTDANGIITKVNEAYCRLVEKSREELEGKPLSVVFRADRKDEIIRKHISNFAHHHIQSNTERELELWNGERRWVYVSNSYVLTEGHQLQLLATFRDITERKRTEDLIRRSDEQLRFVTQNSQDLIFRFEVRPVARYMFVSPSVSTLIGYTPEELFQDVTLAAKIIHPEDRMTIESVLKGTTDEKVTIDVRLVTKSGELIWTEQKLTVTRNAAGQITAVEGIARDITERKRINSELKSYNGLLTSMLENIPFDFWVRDAQGKIIIHSKSGRDLWGDLKGTMADESMADPGSLQHWNENNERAMGGEIVRGEWEYVLPTTGERRTIFEVIAPYYIDGRTAGLLGMNIDVTEQHELNRQLSLRSAALNAAANSIVITDRDGTIEWVNPAYEAMTGYSSAEAVGRNANVLVKSGIHPEPFYRTMWDTITSGNAWTGEIVNRRKNGVLYVEEQTITPVADKNGAIRHFIGIKQDITERKKIDRQIVRDEQKFRSYMDASPLGIFVKDREGRYEEVNPAGLHMFGYSQQEMEGLTAFKLVDSTSLAAAKELYSTVLHAGFSSGEMLFRRKDGTAFWVRENAVRLSDGKMISYKEDITEQKRLNDLLNNKTRTLQTLLDNAPMGMWMVGKDNRLVFVNKVFCDATGISEERFLAATDYAQLVDPETAAMAKASDAAAMASAEAHVSLEQVLFTDGERHDLEITKVRLQDAAGNISGLIGISRDITDAKKAEEKLSEAKKLYSLFFDQALDGFFFMMLDEPVQWNDAADKERILEYAFTHQRVTEINAAMLQQYGAVREQFIGRTYAEFFSHLPDHGREILRAMFDSGRIHNESNERRMDGSEMWVEGDYICLYDAEGRIRGHFGVQRDVTSRKTSEEELAQYRTKLEGLIQNLPGYIYRTNEMATPSETLYISDNVYAVTGYTASELMNTESFAALMDASDRKKVKKTIRKAWMERKDFELEYRITAKDGSERWLWERGQAVFDGAGTYLYTEGYVTDISVRRETERRLFDAHQQNAAFFEQSSVGMAISGLDMSIRRVNQRFADMLGYSISELVGMSIDSVTHPDDREVNRENSRRLVTSEDLTFGMEKRYIRRDGSILWARIDIVLIRDEKGEPSYFAGIIQDITQERSIAKAVRNLAIDAGADVSEEVFQNIVHNLAEALNADMSFIGLLNPDQRSVTTLAVHRANGDTKPFAYELKGTPCERVLEQGIVYFADKVAEQFPEDRALKVLGMRSYLGMSLVNTRGESIGVLVVLSRTPIHIVQNYSDVLMLFGERTVKELHAINAEQALRRSEEEHRFLVDNAQDVILRISIKGTITYCSRSISRLIGYAPDEVIGTSIKQYIIGREDVQRAYYMVKSGYMEGGASRVEMRLRRKSGEACWVEAIGNAVDYPDGKKQVHVVLRDITERRASEEQLTEAKKLHSLFFNQALDGFFFMMLDEPVVWNDTADKQQLIEYIFTHQRITEINDAMLQQYHAMREEFIGKTPADLFAHDIEEGKKIWTRFFDEGRMHIETDERRLDGSKMWVDGDYICLYDAEGRIRGHFGVQRDVTSKKLADQSVVDQRNELANIIGNLPGYIYRLSAIPEMRCIFISDAVEQITGYSRNEYQENNLAIHLSSIHPDDLARCNETVLHAIGTKRTYELEYRFRRKDGVQIWLWERGNPVLDEDGNIRYVEGYVADISLSKTALEGLQQSEQRFRVVWDSTNEAMRLTNADGNIVMVNEAYCALVRMSREELIGSPLSVVYPEHRADRVMERYRENFRSRDVLEFFEQDVTLKDNSVIFVQASNAFLTLSGEETLLLSVFRDITARVHAEREVLLSEQRYRSLIETSLDGFWAVDMNGNILEVNDAYCRMSGYSREEILGMNIADLEVNEKLEDVVQRIRMIQEHGKLKFESQHRTRSGDLVLVEISTVYHKEWNEILAFFNNVTQKRASEQALIEREIQYRSLITTMHQGMAFHEMIFDANGTPSDYRFLDVNPSFEQLMGMAASELIGRTVLEVLPDTEQHWIENYGLVTITGIPSVIENYSEALGKYFEVVAYRPKPGHFATIITDITDRKRSEEQVIANERQYRLLAENSTDVIWTMTFEGDFTYISPSVLQLRGYTPEEVMQQTLEEVICPGSIPSVVEGLKKRADQAQSGEFVQHEFYEVEQPCKNGTTVWTEVVTHIMRDERGTATGIIGVSRDITARKRSEDLLRARLLLSEFATTHSVKELLQKILDEAERITESTIGFFHFVEDDQNTIALQTWSTNTLATMCQAEGDGKHYPIDKAGVWVECVHQRVPVVHNNFSAVPNRKGLPEGHAPVFRELLIPILRHEKVVGIMGVGNKLFNYDQRDVDIAMQLATMSWDILERRRAELALQKHEQALAGLSTAAVDLLNMNERNSEETIISALSKLGTGLDADRVYIFQNVTDRDGTLYTSMVHEWTDEGITRELQNPRMQYIRFDQELPTIWAALSTGKTLNAYTHELTEPEQILLREQNIQSIILVPIMIDERFWGFLGVDAVRSARRWSLDQDSVVRVAAESIGIAFQRISAVSQLFEREQMLKFALEASGDGVWNFTIPTNELYLSREAKLLAGYQNDEFPDSFEAWMELVHPEDRAEVQIAMDRHLRGEAPLFINEHRLMCKDGSYRWMLDRGKVLTWNKDGTPYQIFGTYSDIHHRKVTEEQVKELNEQLEQKVTERTKQLRESMQEMESFSYSISHDLRAPVRAIDSFTKILSDEEETRLSAEGKRLLNTVRSNTARMGRMIDDLLQFSRMSRAEISKVPFDMGSLVMKVAEEARAVEANRTISIKVHPLPRAYGDPSLLRQVAVNLIGNAVKFTRNRTEAVIEIGGEETEGVLSYWVKDNGTGFDMRYVDKLFGVFQRLHNQKEFEGTGVGLAIVHRILQKHGGNITVQSLEGTGTTFTFTIPAQE